LHSIKGESRASQVGVALKSRTAHAHSARRRLVAHLAAGRTTDLAPEVLRLPARLYTDPVRWQAERHVLFEQTPLVACLTRDIAAPGDRLLFEVVGQSVIVVRGADRQVRAFRTGCAQRAARREGPAEPLRGGRHIPCPFHGWSYDLAGNLSAVPGRAGFDSRTLESCRLSPVAAGEQDGIVFV